ncbi:MAG TPA: hypothetical protein VGS12_11080 [Caulobacteraceae bacterium]|nr:hypothetical protein [Caulobacteraceae bacterium]
MARIALQADLFAAAPPEPATILDPIAELVAMLQELRAAAAHPWTPLSEAMQREYRAQALGRLARPEGEELAAAIMVESERLFASGERD